MSQHSHYDRNPSSSDGSGVPGFILVTVSLVAAVSYIGIYAMDNDLDKMWPLRDIDDIDTTLPSGQKFAIDVLQSQTDHVRDQIGKVIREMQYSLNRSEHLVPGSANSDDYVIAITEYRAIQDELDALHAELEQLENSTNIDSSRIYEIQKRLQELEDQAKGVWF